MLEDLKQSVKENPLAALIVGGLLVIAIIIIAIMQFSGGEAEEEAQEQEVINPENIGGPEEEEEESQAPQADTENEPPEYESFGMTDQPREIDGVMYSQTDEARDEWEPIRDDFLEALLSGDDDIAEQVADYTSDSAQSDLEENPPELSGELLGTDPVEEPYESPFYLQETYETDTNQQITVSFEYSFDGVEGEWIVSSYSLD